MDCLFGSVSVDKGYKNDVLVRVCQRQQSDIHQSENEGSNPSAPVSLSKAVVYRRNEQTKAHV